MSLELNLIFLSLDITTVGAILWICIEKYLIFYIFNKFSFYAEEILNLAESDNNLKSLLKFLKI